ncbi:MAG TPA: maleylpyruvate isomerase N-terminal domain-containing protein [Streptosporangiaceae bacterium]|jgi:uncharacterized protein (TIGR03083 family)|nr:maleylpyruvate isomerase N-terminal domain-containing protein [Streptosporangiaceae bacterium]
MECASSWGLSETAWRPHPVLAAYTDGVTAICQLAERFSGNMWRARTPCPEWRASDVAAHLRCVADDYHEYLNDAPVSRYARLMGSGVPPQSIARKQARQNAAELAALSEARPAEHIAAFAVAARAYAARLPSVWDLPHHQYREQVVTVAGMAGAACAEFHLHAWDLARALGLEHRPAQPEVVLDGWRAGLPHLPVDAEAGWLGFGRRRDPWYMLLLASGRLPSWAGRLPPWADRAHDRRPRRVR